MMEPWGDRRKLRCAAMPGARTMRFICPGEPAMLGVSLALLVFLGQASAAPTPEQLVGQLGAKKFAEREAASKGLEELGKKALPALQAARNHADLEVRTRVASLLDKIEGSLLTQPTMIELDFVDQPLTEVVKQMSARAGVQFVLTPANLPTWRTAKVTLRSPRPQTFWNALQMLCEAAGLQYNAGFAGMATAREPEVHLFVGVNRGSPVSVSGPFRTSVAGLTYQRNVVFQSGGMLFQPNLPQGFAQLRRPPPAPGPQPGGDGRLKPFIASQFNVQFQVEAEPRLSLAQRGVLKIQEATDEAGQSLIIANQAEIGVVDRQFAFAALNHASILHMNVSLNHPPKLGGTLKTLKGVIPVTVSARKNQPLVVSLAGAKGKAFENEDVVLNVHDIKQVPNGSFTQVELTVRPKNAPNNNEEMPVSEFMMARAAVNPQQIDFLDDRGRTIPWQFSGYIAEGSRITLTLTPPDPALKATQLRYFGMSRIATDVSFDLHDIPMP
jgi:hypothetical protein